MLLNNILALKRVFLIVAVAILTAIPQQSCELIDILSVNCAECYIDEPTHGELLARVTINEENVIVPIVVFNGPFENNEVVLSDTASSKDFSLWLRTGVSYTVRAEYQKQGRTYYVINGAKLKTLRDYDTCSEPCYYVIGQKIDLRLRF